MGAAGWSGGLTAAGESVTFQHDVFVYRVRRLQVAATKSRNPPARIKLPADAGRLRAVVAAISIARAINKYGQTNFPLPLKFVLTPAWWYKVAVAKTFTKRSLS